MALRAISFDLFDTLVDLDMEGLPAFEVDGALRRGTHPELHRVLQERGPTSFPELCRALEGVDRELRDAWAAEGRELPTRMRFEALTRSLGIDDPTLPGALTQAHMRALQGQASTPAHHAGVLDQLALRCTLALCSNFSHAQTARDILESARMLGQFRAVVISEEVGFRKPRSEIFHAVLRGLEVEPHELLHVGDRLGADVAGAARLGVRTAWLTRRVRDPDAERRAYSGPAPDHVLRDLSELIDLVGRAD